MPHKFEIENVHGSNPAQSHKGTLNAFRLLMLSHKCKTNFTQNLTYIQYIQCLSCTFNMFGNFHRTRGRLCSECLLKISIGCHTKSHRRNFCLHLNPYKILDWKKHITVHKRNFQYCNKFSSQWKAGRFHKHLLGIRQQSP